jgi:hypothetical protein
MDTTTSIIITQIPIALAILYCAYEVKQTKKEFMKLLEKLVNKSNNKK